MIKVIMATQSGFTVFLATLLLVFACSVTASSDVSRCSCSDGQLKRSTFNEGFVFGAGGSAYQLEGGWNKGGKGLSNWDYFTHAYPDKIKDGSNGDRAVDSYHKYKDDIAIVKEMGLDAYRFSISWARILPYGTLYGGVVNLRGIQYYNNIINELIANGKVPYVTLFHWDLPQALEEEFGGFLNRRIVKEFRYFADICFSHFGDRVKHWFTLNEPWSFSYYGYVLGTLAPGRCSSWQHKNCTGGNSGEEPYWVTHNQILAHAAAVKVYRDRYQSYQKGGIGITLVSQYYEPCSDSNSGDEAVQRGLDFMLGWFLHPITYGDYPETMRSLVGERLPKFSQKQSKLLIGSFDFLGVNYYTTYYAVDAPKSNGEHPSYLTDSQIKFLTSCNGVPIGPRAGNSDWLYIYPKGLRKLLNYIKQNYKDPQMFITENGVSEDDDPTLALIEALNDTIRRDYIEDHLCCLDEAIKEDGINMLGYFVWSLMDNFEWNSGSSVRFGVNYVDYKHGLHRYAKLSALWFKRFLSEEGSVSIPRISLDRGKDTYSVSSSVI